MNLTVIVVYNRIDNIQHWLNCWQQCEQHSQLVIIHTGEGVIEVPKGVTYIKRKNIGFDIGCLQDVCKERLQGFPNNWQKMLWITDDTVPMAKDFDKQFFDALDKPNAGCACMQISPSVRRHIRTTGFAIKKELSKQLKFSVDPIVTKEDCYTFEHRSEQILYNQIVGKGLEVVQVAPSTSSPLWDTGYKKALDRRNEHALLFPKRASNGLIGLLTSEANGYKVISDMLATPLISIICPAYNNYPVIVASMLAQTYTNWELHLVHDGPDTTGIKKLLPQDKRITFETTPKHIGNWGHYIRQQWINKVKGNYILITNADNYHTPNYLEAMLKGFTPSTTATYCSQMVHSYIKHGIINCKVQRGYIDCAGVMVKSYAAKEVGWQDVDNHSSDWTYFEDIVKRFGVDTFTKVEGCLLVHN
jgi:hypothetical protein